MTVNHKSKKSTYIIAEAGVNHNGSLSTALKLCSAAKDSGADCVKFQTFKTGNVVTTSAPTAEYQKDRKSFDDRTQFKLLKELELKYTDFEKIKKRCDDIGIDFLSTPDDNESLHFLIRLGIPTIKIGSGEVTNTPFLREIGKTTLPVILSTGMSNLSEVYYAVHQLQTAGTSVISLMQCTSRYPCPVEDVNLQAMKTLREAFQVPVGFSDHTEGIAVPIAAVALGATIIEKHFTLDRSMVGPDHRASLNPNTFSSMVKGIREVETAFGSGIKEPSFRELETAAVVRRKIVACSPIAKGDSFSVRNITTKRTGVRGISAEYWDLLCGRTATKDYAPDEAIDWC